ncbi:MAG: hypothetical protein HY652_14255 [Acidobacteria bacterium]|nr:hypothetical protein [Acidobacteriota bacterium]
MGAIRHRTKPIWIGCLAVTVALGLVHQHILTGVASFMTIRDPLEKADLILPLYHEGHTVPFSAADLYHRGYADRVALERTRPSRLERLGLLPPPHEVWRKVLEAEGVPAEAIVTIGSPVEDRRKRERPLATFLRSRGKSRVIVVASAPWSRLSRNDLLRGLAGSSVEVRMYPVRPREFDESTWWRSRHGLVTYFDVYYLWLVRFLRD